MLIALVNDCNGGVEEGEEKEEEAMNVFREQWMDNCHDLLIDIVWRQSSVLQYNAKVSVGTFSFVAVSKKVWSVRWDEWDQSSSYKN